MTSFYLNRTKVYEERRVLSSPSLKRNRKVYMGVRIFLGYAEQSKRDGKKFHRMLNKEVSSLFLIWN